MKATSAVFMTTSLLFFPARGWAQSAVPWSSFDMGFAASSSAATTVLAVVGQAFVGRMQGPTTRIESGLLVDTLFRGPVTSVADPIGIPTEFALRQNYPNPFNPSTTIRIELPNDSKVSLNVYNALGQEVATLADGERPAGVYDVRFDARNLASGMYVYRLQAGDYVAAKRLLLLR